MKFKKKSLHIITGLGQGGAESILSKLVIRLQNENINYQQIVISLSLLDYHTKNIRFNGIDVYHVGMKNFFDVSCKFYWRVCFKIFFKKKCDLEYTSCLY